MPKTLQLSEPFQEMTGYSTVDESQVSSGTIQLRSTEQMAHLRKDDHEVVFFKQTSVTFEHLT